MGAAVMAGDHLAVLSAVVSRDSCEWAAEGGAQWSGVEAARSDRPSGSGGANANAEPPHHR